jgi:ribA/ribD-fused uncharacterized protein
VSAMPEIIDHFDGEHAFLSNFHPSQINWLGRECATVEHAFQMSKTLISFDRDFVAEAATPGRAKRLGRGLHLRGDWEEIKDDVMRTLLLLKFSQNSELWALLDATGDATLVEGNTWGDTYWGALRKPDGTYDGLNKLGMMLMDTRTLLRRIT